MNPFQSVYDSIGESKIRTLCHYFYLNVDQNAELRKLYPEDLKPAEERLCLFLIQVFGGPTTYSEKRGHPRLRMRHLKWEIDSKMRNHWLNAMLSAMDQVKMETQTRELMMGYFIKVAEHMINHD